MGTVYDALADAQAKIAVPKGRNNDFGGYKYRKAEDIITAFRAANITGASLMLTDRLEEIGGQIFVVASAVLTFGGEKIVAEAAAMHSLTKKGMDASQITGSASSYARKYALQGLFAIDDGEADPDSRDNRKENGNDMEAHHGDPVKEAVGCFEKADTLEAANAIWRDLPAPLKADQRVIDAAKAAKARNKPQVAA